VDGHLTVDTEIKTIRELIDRQARTMPEATFLISPETGRVVTFSDLQEQTRVLATQLQACRLERGNKVALLFDNGLFAVEWFLGTMYGGFVSVPLNVRAGISTLSFSLDHSDAKVVVVGNNYADLIKEVMANVRRAVKVIPTNVDGFAIVDEAQVSSASLPTPTSEDLALLMYTSGSTGRPKAAMHSHRTVLSHGRNSISAHRLTSEDRSLLVLPLYHINAECVTLIPALLSGGSVVVPHVFSVSQFWDWLDHYRCTWSAVVPTIISQLLDWNDPDAERRQASFERIRFLRSSSAPLSPSLHREFLAKFKLLLVQAMGSTEAGNIFSNPLPPAENKIGSPGLPWGFETKIMNQEGAETRVGEPGEVFIRGPAMMQGYYKDSEGTATVLGPDGWFRTGDLAYRDADGYFFVVGRSKELIIKGGVNIAPKQIDEVIESHPAVLEAAAVGVTDRYVGEDVVAFVVARAGKQVSEKELLTFCESRLGYFKTPTRIYFVTELPKGPSGKVQRLKLQEKAEHVTVVEADRAESESSLSATELASGPRPVSQSTPIEQMIAATWTKLLGQPVVDVDSNFFSLGGHSLLAIQCLSRLRERLPLTLSLSDFFENATVAQQAALIRKRLPADYRSTEESTAAWEQELLDKIGPPAADERIPLRDRSLPCPLSPNQRRIWFMEQLNPGVPVYNESEAVRLRGDLNIEVLERALNVIIERHEILRTTILPNGDEPKAVVLDSWPLRLKQIDLSSLPAEQREEEMERLLVDEPRIPYHVETEPGIRATLLRLGTGDHVFILMMHHLICDWSSEGVLWRELSALYCAGLHGQPPALPLLPIQHGDYAAWEQKRMIQNRLAEDLAYWVDNLRGAPPLLELPTDRLRPRINSYQGSRKRFRIPPILVQALRECSRREKFSLFTVFTAALDILLYRYTGQEDILLGIPLADRDRPELQSVIGFLLHTHVLRTQLAADLSFRELLSRVQKGVLDLYAHRSVPFEQVVRSVQTERSLSYSPLFQVAINWRDRDQQLTFIGMEGLVVESLLAETKTSKFDLTFTLTDDMDEIGLEIEYLTDLFDEARIERMVSHYQTLLEALAADSSQLLSALPLLTGAERQQLLGRWNDTKREYPRDQCLQEIFEEQAAQRPEAVAVVFGREALTYRELNERAERLAHHLRGLGVGPEVLVGLSVERSLEMVVALLGILKAGGAYWALEENLPEERFRLMLAEARPRVLLVRRKRGETQSGKAGPTPAEWAAGLVTVAVIEDLMETAPAGKKSPVPRSQAGAPAYVSYTSGSTGRPKGVVVPHRAVMRLVRGCDYVTLNAEETLLHLSPLSFDASTFELWGALLNGGRVVLLPPGPPTLTGIGEAIRQQGVTTLWLTAGLFHLMVDERLEDLRPLRQLLAGGDVLSPEQVRQARRLLPGCRIINGYGPTENTTFTCSYTVGEERDLTPSVPIGRPIANTQVYVLDANREPVPLGVAGELYAGGDGVACGYLNQPELTAERFVPDRFSNIPGAKLYRTGDRVRWRTDGNLEFLGRLDDQVKIRGYRIELGEIETALGGLPEVRQAAVVVREDSPGDKRLVAYLAGRPGEKIDASTLRHLLGSKLPEYMVPSAFVWLEQWPLTPNGKVDRKALEKLEGVELATGTEYVAPRNQRERELAEIWQAVLRREKVGVHDNFFHLGGHSLLVVVMCSRIKRSLGLDVPLRWVFEHPTIEGLAEQMESLSEDLVSTRAVELAERQKPLVTSFGQQGMWLLQQTLPDPATYNQPFALCLTGSVEGERVRRALQAMLERHEILRTALVQQGENLVQEVTPAKEVALPWREMDLQGVTGNHQDAALEDVLLAQARQPFELGRAPLWRVAWIKLAEAEHVLALTFHHSIMDEWSRRIFIQELERLYEADGQIERAGLAELPVQFADFAAWQRRRLSGALLEQQRSYWREQLQDLPPALELPVDGARPPQLTGRGAAHNFKISPALVARLRELAREEGTTLFTVVLAAFQVWLYRYTGQNDLVVGAPITNRGRTEFETMLGFFLNTLPLRVRLEGSLSFRQVLRQVHESFMGAISHADLPFEQMVEMAVKERKMGQQPLYQVMFVLLEEGLPALRLDQAKGRRVPMGTGTSKNDLMLSIQPGEQEWKCQFEYATDLFSGESVARMARHLTELLESITEDPAQSICRLRLMSAEELRQVLEGWNDTKREYPSEKCVHELFEEQAEKTPEAVAVIFEGREVNYRELNARANQLAHYLRELGVKPDGLVAICLERGIEMVVGLLGILKAGGAYVPLDPAYPIERLSHMLRDSGAAVLLTQGRLERLFKEMGSILRVIDLAIEVPPWTNQPESNPNRSDVGLTPEHLAYVIYTSGSTGLPKGVAMHHSALVNLLWWQKASDSPLPQRTLQFAALGFDVAFQEIFSALSCGGVLVLIETTTRRPP